MIKNVFIQRKAKLLEQYLYIPISTLFVSVFEIFWHYKIQKRTFKGPFTWISLVFGAFFISWGLDALHYELNTNTFYNMMILSTGVWLMFIFASFLKFRDIYSVSTRELVFDLLGMWASFLLAGIVIYVLS